MRNWLKKLIIDAIKSSVKERALILSYRLPTSQDVYEKGCIWKNGEDVYELVDLTARWEAISKNKGSSDGMDKR